MKTYALILEVTRRCNMSCAHCLRGPAQNIDMTEDIMRKTFKIFDEIDSLVFSGGEPSLNIPLLQKTVDYIINHDIFIENFFIATNGKENVDELLQVLDQLYIHTQSSWIKTREAEHEYKKTTIRLINGYFSENIGYLALSSDPYHGPIPTENIIKLMSRKYFTTNKIQDFASDHSIIRRGNAVYLPADLTQPVKTQTFEAYDGIFEQIYINAEGLILPDCDQDYANQQYDSCGSVFDEDILDTLQELIERG